MKVLPLVDDGYLAPLELPAGQLEPVVDQDHVHHIVGVGHGTMHKYVVASSALGAFGNGVYFWLNGLVFKPFRAQLAMQYEATSRI